MTASFYLQDAKGTSKRVHLHQRNGDVGVIAFTEPLIRLTPLNIPAVNPDFGNQMARDASFTGTPDLVHNGVDTVAWTGSNIVGAKVTFNSAAQAHSGTQSVLVNAPSAGHIWEFDKGSNLTVGNYTAITLWIYVDSGWSAGDVIQMFGYDTGLGTQVGGAVSLGDYFNFFEFSTWHKLVIPLADMSLTSGTIDAIRMGYPAKDGGAPVFYIDDFQVEETGGAVCFDIIPPPQTRYLVSKFRYTVVDGYAGTVTNGTMPGLAYNQLLGLASLSGGLAFSLIQDGETAGTASISDLGDAARAGAEIINHMSDGTNTSVTILREFVEPIILSSKNNDRIAITISDDLSGLISLTAVATGATMEESL